VLCIAAGCADVSLLRMQQGDAERLPVCAAQRFRGLASKAANLKKH
jgi:hypothetical protein